LNYIRDDGFHASAGGVAQYAVYTAFAVRVSETITASLSRCFPAILISSMRSWDLPNGSFTGGKTTYAAFTTGFTITPSIPPNPFGIKQVIMRPEVRYDTSLKRTTPFGGSTKDSE
jgi:hypothetical protein